MPRLHMVQSGIQCYVSEQDSRAMQLKLPITPSILLELHDYGLPKSAELDTKMLWAASVICFFGSFRAREITVPHSIPVFIWPGVMCL